MSLNGGINTRKGSDSPLFIYFCIFVAVFLLSFLFVSFVAGIVGTLDIDERAKVLVTSAVQNLFVFIGTPLITARVESQNTIKVLSLNVSPGWSNVLLVAVCYFIGMCFLNQLIFWNDSIVFPESLHELEEKLRGWENSSRHFTDAILSTTTIPGLVSGIAIVGCLTGFAEELFFRAGIQRQLCKAIPGHAAVWISAFIFSAMHFQFFGFFPRLLLGAIFGYFYLWSGSIWTSVIAHALNNSMVVITAWLMARGCVSADIENFGVSESGFPWFAMSSGILLILVLYLWQKNYQKIMANPTFRDILTSINKGVFAPVYLLMGEEDYYIDRIVDAIESKAITEEDKDFNLNVYYGVDADMETVVAAGQQLPVMAPRRVVILKEAQSKQQAKQSLERLAPYVGHPNASTVFVVAFKGDNLNATSSLMKNAAKSGAVIFKSERVKDYQLASHLRDYCASYKCMVDDKAMEMLCEYIGGPLTKLFGEVNKLIQIKGGAGQRITAEDIERNIGISKDFNNFELVSAVANKNYPKAIRIIKYFESNPKTNPTIMTTSTLFNFFSKLVIAHYLTDKSEPALKAALGIRFQNQLNEIKTGMRNYNPLRAVNAVHALREFDVKSKGVNSFQNEYALLTELIFKIFTL